MARKVERIDAKRLYCDDLKEISEIAKILSVPEKTIYRWASEGSWDKEREEIRTTSSSAVKQMLRAAAGRLTDMVEEIKVNKKINPSEVYALRQLILSAKSLQKEVDMLGNILLAVQELTEFIAERDTEILETIRPLLAEFGPYISKKYGKR